MPKAVWKGTVIAQSDATIQVEGNHYFPPDSLNSDFFTESDNHSVCPWKGVASYLDISVGGDVNRAGAWFYPNPSAAASDIKDYVAFWHGVKVKR